MMKANDYQIAGAHYRKRDGEQHWDRAWRLYGPGYFQAQITRYVERYLDKNGIEDLKKARHFLDKLIELEEEKAAKEKEPAASSDTALQPRTYHKSHVWGWTGDYRNSECVGCGVHPDQPESSQECPKKAEPVIQTGNGWAEPPGCESGDHDWQDLVTIPGSGRKCKHCGVMESH